MSGAEVWGARHSVTSGGTYPSRLTITGGYFGGYSNSSTSVDSHGVVKDFIVNGAVIHGGISCSADYNLITNNIIYFNDTSGIVANNDNNSDDWGTFIASGNIIQTNAGIDIKNETPAISVFGRSREITIENNSIDGDWGGVSGQYFAPVYIGSRTKDKFVVRNNSFRSRSGSNDMLWYLSGISDKIISGNEFINCGLRVRPNDSVQYVYIKDNIVKNAHAHGFHLHGYENNTFKSAVIQGNVSVSNGQSGVYVTHADLVTFKMNRCNNNGKQNVGNDSNKAGFSFVDCGDVVCIGNEGQSLGTTSQVVGLYLLRVGTISLIGNNFTGNQYTWSLSDTTFLSRLGNVGSAGSGITDWISGSDNKFYAINNGSIVEMN